MTNLFLIIRAMFSFKIYYAFLLLLLLAGSVLSQTGGSSVMIYPQGKEGTKDNGNATVLSNMIATELFKQFPCVDSLTADEVKSLIGLERWRQLLGQEPDNEMLRNLAGGIGARYIIVVTSNTLPNGQTVLFTKVIDGATGQMIANRISNDVDAAKAAASLVGQILKTPFYLLCKGRYRNSSD